MEKVSTRMVGLVARTYSQPIERKKMLKNELVSIEISTRYRGQGEMFQQLLNPSFGN